MSDEPSAAAEPSADGRVTARIDLRAFAADRVIELEVPTGPRRVVDLLPIARALSDELTAAAIDNTQRAGRAVSCRAACGACCRQLVSISLVEAQGLAELVAALPPERQAVIRERFAAAVRRLEEAGLLERGDPRGLRGLVVREAATPEAAVHDLARRYFAQRIACPFLENESCGIYEERPSVCREYHVTSPPAHCATLFQNDVERIDMPKHIGDALTSTAHRVTGQPLATIPLTLALEFSDVHGGTFAATHDGIELFEAFMREL